MNAISNPENLKILIIMILTKLGWLGQLSEPGFTGLKD